MLTLESFEEAAAKVKEVTQETKLIYSSYFSDMTGNKVYLKPENMQRTGAYKVRGAYSMADMRLAIGCWRSIIESKFRTVLSQFNTLFKNHVVGPEFLDFLLSLNKILIGTYFVIHLVSSLYKKQSRFLCFKWNVPWHIHAPGAVVQQKKLPLRIGMKACIH